MPELSPGPKPPSRDTLAKYGLTAEDWMGMCRACRFTCVVCGKPFGGRPLVVDHEHVKGFKAHKTVRAKGSGRPKKVRVMSPADRRRHVRGVIHNYCNRFVRRWLTLDRARAIVKYLEAHHARGDR